MILQAVYLGDLWDGALRLLTMCPQESQVGVTFHTLTICSGLGLVAGSEDHFVLSIGVIEDGQFREKAQVSLRDGLGSGRNDFPLVPGVRVDPGAVVALKATARGQPSPLAEVSVIPQCGTLVNRRL